MLNSFHLNDCTLYLLNYMTKIKACVWEKDFFFHIFINMSSGLEGNIFWAKGENGLKNCTTAL